MKYPEGPSTPKILQMLQWVTDPVGYMEAAARDYGDIFNTLVLGKPRLFVSNPQALQQIFTNDTKQFTAPGDLNIHFQPLAGEYSLFMLSGTSHQRQRQMLMPGFHGDRLLSYGKLICKIASQVMNQLPPGKPFFARSAMEEISMQVILQAVFGVSSGKGQELLKQGLSSMLDIFQSPLIASLFYFPGLRRDLGPWSLSGKLIRQRQQVDEMIYAEIFSRRQQPDPSGTDVLSLLIAARDEAGEPMTDVELHDQLLALLIAGQETTATAMAWALYWVHRLPEVGAKLLAELATLDRVACAQRNPNPDPTSIFQLPYLTAVCNETLRIYPVLPVTFLRVVQESVELLGYSLPPETVLYGCIYLTHQREDIYPEPKQFKPERFLSRQYSPYEFLPFGSGVRRCIGSGLAMYEMKLVLATILSNYQLELADKRPVKPQWRGFALAPAGGVKMVMKGRRDRVKKTSGCHRIPRCHSGNAY
ncbi:MAG: cytochrome P450 [Hormoscilla sp. GM7CHS1pb]|nr:cytochrome P450 [Hormoscilla sp. GM7CHS1pb]